MRSAAPSSTPASPAAVVRGPMTRLHRWAAHPLVVVGALLLGAALAALAPEPSRRLAVVGLAYLDVLRMVVLPYMLAAVIFSLQALLREGGARRIAGRVLAVFAVFSLIAALVAAGWSLAVAPGHELSDADHAILGDLVGELDTQNQAMIRLHEEAVPQAHASPVRVLFAALVPSNIFSALASGETLKALVFALLFGAAVSQVPTRISGGLNEALETVYRTCQTLLRWISLPLPLVLVCVVASQFAQSGFEALQAMAGFVAAFMLSALVLALLALWLLKVRAQRPWGEVASALRESVALALATGSPAVCLPSLIEALAGSLQFARARVELLVPLVGSLLLPGAVAYVASASLFVAQLHGGSMEAQDIGLIVLLSMLAGVAATAMTGIVMLSLVGTVTAALSLPFEAAFVLLAAVDPLCAMARAATSVVAGAAAVAAVCPRPLKL